MSRLRQLNPQNYRSSDRISQEFESVIRYLNAAELGDKTIGELLEKLFDENGDFDGPIEMRLDTTAGLQYRVGEYDTETDGWVTLASLATIRGADGRDFGTVGTPILSNRQNYVATAAQTVFSYTGWTSSDDLMVFKNGALQREGASYDYQKSSVNQTVTFNSGLALNDKVAIYRVRVASVENFLRSDMVAATNQVVFPFNFSDSAILQVYRNGILQREGGSYDYVLDANAGTINMTSAQASGTVITAITVQDNTAVTVPGLMTEDKYTDGNGLIPYAKVSIADGAIAQAKVNGLTSLLANRGRVYVSASTPVSATAGDFWIDTSAAPNILKFYNGTAWVLASPNLLLPSVSSLLAGQYLRVNTGGTGYEVAPIDLSSRIAASLLGAPNGVAQLDSSGRLPVAQLPATYSVDTIYKSISGSVSNGTQSIQLVTSVQLQIDSISAKLTSGTCTIQLAVDTVGIGQTINVTSSLTKTALSSPVAINALTADKRIGFIITSASSAVDLEVAIAASAVTI